MSKVWKWRYVRIRFSALTRPCRLEYLSLLSYDDRLYSRKTQMSKNTNAKFIHRLDTVNTQISFRMTLIRGEDDSDLKECFCLDSDLKSRPSLSHQSGRKDGNMKWWAMMIDALTTKFDPSRIRRQWNRKFIAGIVLFFSTVLMFFMSDQDQDQRTDQDADREKWLMDRYIRGWKRGSRRKKGTKEKK